MVFLWFKLKIPFCFTLFPNKRIKVDLWNIFKMQIQMQNGLHFPSFWTENTSIDILYVININWVEWNFSYSCCITLGKILSENRKYSLKLLDADRQENRLFYFIWNALSCMDNAIQRINMDGLYIIFAHFIGGPVSFKKKFKSFQESSRNIFFV